MPEVELPAGTIHYEDTGGDGPVVVLLHGLIMDHTLWRDVVPELRDEYRCVLPTLPLGAHRTPMKPGADLELFGQVALVADFLEALDLRDVALVVSDWGGGMLLTHIGRDERVGRLIILPSEAWENYPPGLPGRMAGLAVKLPGGIALALRQMRMRRLRASPLLFGWMAKRPIAQDIIEGWTAPGLASPRIREDLRRYGRTPMKELPLAEATDALARFGRPALVIWGREDKVMPPAHGRRLAELMPDARHVELDDTYVLVSLDQPRTLAAHMRAFLAETSVVAAA